MSAAFFCSALAQRKTAAALFARAPIPGSREEEVLSPIVTSKTRLLSAPAPVSGGGLAKR
jgi:hypothetical protein